MCSAVPIQLFLAALLKGYPKGISYVPASNVAFSALAEVDLNPREYRAALRVFVRFCPNNPIPLTMSENGFFLT